jgi:hypothetical protein
LQLCCHVVAFVKIPVRLPEAARGPRNGPGHMTAVMWLLLAAI